MRRGRPYEIAIIGMGCRFPGASDLTGVLREHPRRQGLHERSAARSLERPEVLRPGFSVQRSRSLVQGRLPGFTALV